MVHNRHGLAAIDHIVVLMLENRSFDHVLGYLYRDTGNLTEIGLDFDRAGPSFRAVRGFSTAGRIWSLASVRLP